MTSSFQEQGLASLAPLVARVRTDVTAVRKAKGGQAWTREALTDERLARHLNGGPARGVSPIKAGESVTMVAVLDLDSHQGETPWQDMADVALRVMSELELRGLAPLPFRSTGGRGIHVYLVWDEPQDARSVRIALADALEACGLRNGTKGVAAGQVEIFPKQDSVPADGFGNQFILPLAGQSVPLEPLLGLEPLTREHIVQWQPSAPVPIAPPPEPRAVVTEISASLEVLRSALAAIPNEGEQDLGYDDWRNVVFAIHDATDGSDEGLQLAHEFSARSPKYDATFLDGRVWPYVREREGGITVRSIMAMAREHGWREPVEDDFDVIVPEEPENATPPAKFQVIPAAEFAGGPPPTWLIKDVLPQAALAVIYGDSGSGKTFVTLDLAFAIARGVEWRGNKVRQGRVVYVAAEGAGGLRKRLAAYAKQHGVDLANVPLGVIADAPNLLDKGDTRELLTAIRDAGGAAVVVIDTLAQTTPGGNENAAEDMGKALGHCKAIHRVLGSLVVLVHHSGKDASKGARGWSGLRAAADAELEVLRLPTARVLRVSKQKDGDDGGRWAFDLTSVPLGMDDDGDVITSCVAIETAMPVTGSTSTKPLGRVETIVNTVIQEMAQAQTTGIEVDAVLVEAARRLPAPEEGRRDTRKQHAKRALMSLTTGDEAPYWVEDGCLSVM